MFGKKKKKKAQLEQAQNVTAEVEAPETDVPTEDTVEQAPADVAEQPVSEAPAAEAPAEDAAEAPATEGEETADAADETAFYESEIVDDEDDIVELEPSEDKAAAEAETEAQDGPKTIERVLYEVEPFEDVEQFKPARLQMLPNLINYMLGHNPPKRTTMILGVMLIAAYSKFKDNPAEVNIIKRCIKKVTNEFSKEVKIS